jgi:hypothetical protein
MINNYNKNNNNLRKYSLLVLFFFNFNFVALIFKVILNTLLHILTNEKYTKINKFKKCNKEFNGI